HGLRRCARGRAEGQRQLPDPAPHRAVEGRVLDLRALWPAVLGRDALGAHRRPASRRQGGVTGTTPRRQSLATNLGLGLAVSALLLLGLEWIARAFEPKRASRPVASYIWDWQEKWSGDFYS